MFIDISGTILNITQIVAVVPEAHTYTFSHLDYSDMPMKSEDSHTSYKIHVNTVNFKHDKHIDRYEHDDSRYEYTFHMSDKDEWKTVYENICSALGVVGDIQDVRHNFVQA